MYAHKSYTSNNFKGAISEFKGVFHRMQNFEELPHESIEAPLSEHFFTMRMKLPSRPDGFMYGKQAVEFFSTSGMLYLNMKIKLRQIRARPNFYKISDNPNVFLGSVDCSLSTRRVALKDI